MNHHEPTENAWLKKCLDQKIPTQNSVVHPNRCAELISSAGTYHHGYPWFIITESHGFHKFFPHVSNIEVS